MDRCCFEALPFLDTSPWVCIGVPWFVVLAYSVLRRGKDIPRKCGYPLPLGAGTEYPCHYYITIYNIQKYEQYPLRPNSPRKSLWNYICILPLVLLYGALGKYSWFSFLGQFSEKNRPTDSNNPFQMQGSWCLQSHNVFPLHIVLS